MTDRVDPVRGREQIEQLRDYIWTMLARWDLPAPAAKALGRARDALSIARDAMPREEDK